MRKPRKSKAKSHFYTLTIFKFEDILKQIVDSRQKILYAIIGYEVCPKTSRPHVQCYIVFKDKLTRRQVLNVLPESYAEVAKSSPLDNYRYCSKDGKFFQFGSYKAAVQLYVDVLYDKEIQPPP